MRCDQSRASRAPASACNARGVVRQPPPDRHVGGSPGRSPSSPRLPTTRLSNLSKAMTLRLVVAHGYSRLRCSIALAHSAAAFKASGAVGCPEPGRIFQGHSYDPAPNTDIAQQAAPTTAEPGSTDECRVGGVQEIEDASRVRRRRRARCPGMRRHTLEVDIAWVVDLVGEAVFEGHAQASRPLVWHGFPPMGSHEPPTYWRHHHNRPLSCGYAVRCVPNAEGSLM
jgi:hypothetical protein